MVTSHRDTIPAGANPRRLFCFSTSFLRPPLRDMLRAAGHAPRLGWPGPKDHVAVWGQSPTAWRGEWVARHSGAQLIRLEDAFLRSIAPTERRSWGLLIDEDGLHFDASQPSRIERLAQEHPLDDMSLLQRSSVAIARIIGSDISKYNNFDLDADLPDAGFVLLIDQLQGDASIRSGGASAASFHQMLAQARADHPGRQIVIKSHPGPRPGHFSHADLDARTTLLRHAVSPWRLLARAHAVYAVSSLMGYEAILAGHRPVLFAHPFYAGWGLSEDRLPLPPGRRGRQLRPEQLFAVSHILAPSWYDPCRKRLCSLEQILDQIEAELRAYREDRRGYVACGMRGWKHATMQGFFGSRKPLKFERNMTQAVKVAQQSGRDLLLWGAQDCPPLPASVSSCRVEDGFLRSRGLGAALVAPLSLCADRRGIYYDPRHPSDLEAHIAAPLGQDARARSAQLIRQLQQAKLSKYNLPGRPIPLPQGHRILVPGQVEDDASIRCGAGDISTNLALLAHVRANNPDKIVIFKPHPDVEAGLRPGAIPPQEALRYADTIARHADPIALIDACEEVWTMTSLLGFEALLRGKKVTCTGMPFYAGWGLTQDLLPPPARRKRACEQDAPDLIALTHAALIAYPRYRDPISARPCPPELIIERLSQGDLPAATVRIRLLAKLQGRFAPYAWLWRRPWR